ncbi:MMPL family transporter, partial [Myxococcota bacterium]|nr:MMPL family transporter [Myxococcota bacterium]
MSDWKIRALSVLLIGLAALYCLFTFEISGSITHFIPDHAEARQVQLTLDLLDSPLSRRMVLSIQGGEARNPVTAGLVNRLRKHPEVTWVESNQLSEETIREVSEIYFERRIYFVSENPEQEIPALFEPIALRKQARRLKENLSAPDSILFSRTSQADPLGFFPKILDRIGQLQPLKDPTAEVDYALIFIGLRSSPFEATKQENLVQFIQREFELLAQQQAAPLQLQKSGGNLFAIASEKSIRRDVNLVSSLSIVAVCGIFLLFFGSLRSLFVAFLTPFAGFLFALALSAGPDRPIHGITLAFGFVLIGVAIDSPIHLMTAHSLQKTRGTAFRSARQLRASLIFSAATTTLAFLSLSLSGFPGLSEMGSFAAMGIPVGLAFTLYASPAFILKSQKTTRTQRFITEGFARVGRRLDRYPGIPIFILTSMLVLPALGLSQVRWDDDPSALMQMDPKILKEAQLVQSRYGEFDAGRLVIGLAPDSESALILSETVQQRLQPLVESGAISGLGSVSELLPSVALQERNLAALQAVPQLEAKIREGFAQEGFRDNAFTSFYEAVAFPSSPPLQPRDLQGSFLEKALSMLPIVEGERASITLLRGPLNSEAIKSALSDLKNVFYIDQKAILSDVYRSYRRSTIRMIGIGAVIVLVSLLVRYRDAFNAVMAALPAALGISCTLGLFGIFGIPINVASAISLLVVLGMGADYGIFAVDSAGEREAETATLSSLLVSCLTSVFVFGVLALSSQPVLRTIGFTTAIGVSTSLCVAPLILSLVRRRRPQTPLKKHVIVGLFCLALAGCQGTWPRTSLPPCRPFVIPPGALPESVRLRGRI